MERVTRSGMLNPGEGWQDFRHHGRGTALEYRLRVRCAHHYYGPACNRLCRPRDDFFGHHGCDATGSKVCLDGWTGEACTRGTCWGGGAVGGGCGGRNNPAIVKLCRDRKGYEMCGTRLLQRLHHSGLYGPFLQP